MKRRFALSVFVFVIFFSTTSVYAAEKFSFSATPSIGVTSGVVREYVMHGGKPASRLDWITFANPTAQIDARISFFGVFLDANASINVPMRCGMMEDRDWENGSSINYPVNKVIIYSKHDMDLKSRYNFAAKLGYKFDINNFSIAPFAGIKYGFHSFDGLNGYQQRNDEGVTGNEPHSADFNRKVISYEQSLLLPSVGANFSLGFTEKLIAYLGLTFYPYMMINAVDKHYSDASGNKGSIYYDTMHGGFGFVLDAAVEYKKFVFKLEYESVFHYTGQTRSGSIGTSYPDASLNGVYKSGTDSFMFKLSVGYKIN